MLACWHGLLLSHPTMCTAVVLQPEQWSTWRYLTATGLHHNQLVSGQGSSTSKPAGLTCPTPAGLTCPTPAGLTCPTPAGLTCPTPAPTADM
jgi:hypothetical protein